MWRSHDNMDHYENRANRKSQTGGKETHRLYPSLPDIDQYDAGQRLPAVHSPDSLPGDPQSAAGAGVGVKAKILALEEQRHELISINERWAKEYNTMVHYYKDQVRGLKTLLQHEDEEPREGENTLRKKVKHVEETDDKLLKAEKEAEELRMLCSTLTRRGRHQHQEIRRLNEALKEALQTPERVTVSSDIWKHQAQVYKEDFLKERSDREKLKEKYLEQEKKFRKVHSELRLLKSEVTWVPPSRPVPQCTCGNAAAAAAAFSRWEVHQVGKHHLQLQRRHTLGNKA